MSEAHGVTALREKRGDAVRWRGRCSCGAQTYMHYSSPDTARTALRRTHLRSLAHQEKAGK